MKTTYPKRKFVRLPEFDYSQPGAYFVTICSVNKQCIFGHIIDARMQLNDLGQLVNIIWRELPKRHPSVTLDDCVVMPNHLHGIIWIAEENYKK